MPVQFWNNSNEPDTSKLKSNEPPNDGGSKERERSKVRQNARKGRSNRQSPANSGTLEEKNEAVWHVEINMDGPAEDRDKEENPKEVTTQSGASILLPRNISGASMALPKHSVQSSRN